MKTVYQFFLVLFVFSSLTSHAYAEKKNSILVSQDFTEALAKSLTEGTTIKIVRAIPPKYGTNTHTSYMKRHWETFSQHSMDATAVLTLASSWPEDPLYPWTRRANIKIVPIDASNPLDHTRAGVPLLEIPGSKTQLRFIWNSPGNTARMADIAATDLIHLFPSEKDTIAKNRDRLKQQLFKLRSRYETAFSELDTYEVIAFTADFYYLTDEFGVGVAQFFLKPMHRWEKIDKETLAAAIKATGVNCIIAKWLPDKEILDIIEQNGAKVIVPKPFILEPEPSETVQLISFYETNLAILLKGLSK